MSATPYEALRICDLAVERGHISADRRREIRLELVDVEPERATGEWLVAQGHLSREQAQSLRQEVSQGCGSVPADSGGRPGIAPDTEEVADTSGVQAPSDSAETVVEASTRPFPRRLGRYELLSEIGRGGMGVVYLAQDTVLQAPAAVKLLPSHLVAHHEARERLLREARNAALLRNHPNIVTTYEACIEDPCPYVAMEYVEGATLSDMIHEAGRVGRGLPVPEAMNYASQIASGLAEAHSHHVVHRDIKPHNIRITSSTPQTAKILDFGIAKDLMSRFGPSFSGGVCGTFAYLPPRILAMALGDTPLSETERVSTTIDVYGLGVTLWEMLAGHNPWRDATTPGELLAMKQRGNRCEALPPLPKDIPESVIRALDRLLSDDPAERCEDAREATEVLEGASRDTNTQRPTLRRDVSGNEEGGHFLEEYGFGERSIKLYMGDITDLQVDAIVSSDDTHLTMSGSVSSRIRERGGQAICDEAREQLPATAGSVLVTSGGDLGCRFVLHALLLDIDTMVFPSLDTVRRCTQGVFERMRKLGLRSVALPALASGAAGLAIKDVTKAMLEATIAALGRDDYGVDMVILAFLKPDRFAGYVRSQILAMAPSRISVRRSGRPRAQEPPSDDEMRVPSIDAADEPTRLSAALVYDVGELLFVSELGRTYLATDRRLGRLVGLTVCDCGLPERMRDECVLMQSIRYPGIASVIDAGALDRAIYYVQTYHGSRTLRDVFDACPAPERQAMAFWFQLLDAFERLHSRSIVLKSLRPDKIVVDDTGQRVVIMDWFGWALRGVLQSQTLDLLYGTGCGGETLRDWLGAAATVAGGGMGTLTQMFTAPEAMVGGNVGKHSDIYVLGGLLAFLLTGRTMAGKIDPISIIEGRRPWIAEVLRHVKSWRMRAIIAIATGPAKFRPQSIEALREALEMGKSELLTQYEGALADVALDVEGAGPPAASRGKGLGRFVRRVWRRLRGTRRDENGPG